ncbi:MAG: putative Ig domain-containing protein, partial [Planctomycetota bacterium]
MKRVVETGIFWRMMLALLLTTAMAGTAWTYELSLSPTDDAYVRSGNNSGATYNDIPLRVRAYADPNLGIQSFLKFDLTGMPPGADIIEAKLWLQTESTVDIDDVIVYSADNNLSGGTGLEWEEETTHANRITWDTKPGHDPNPLASRSNVGLGERFALESEDLKTYVSNSGTLTFMLWTTDTDSVRDMKSKESGTESKRPLLEVTFEHPDVPSFVSNPVVAPGAVEGIQYTGTLEDAITDDNGYAGLTFTILDGPTWLELAADDHTFQGIPTAADVGLNTFTIKAEDEDHYFHTGTVHIMVNSAAVFGEQTRPYTPTDDAYVKDDFGSNYNVDTNFDGTTAINLRVRLGSEEGPDAGANIRSFMKFDLTTVDPDQVLSSVLDLTLGPDVDINDLYLYSANNDYKNQPGVEWTEGVITWNNSPTYDPNPLGSVGYVQAGVTEPSFTVTSHVLEKLDPTDPEELPVDIISMMLDTTDLRSLRNIRSSERSNETNRPTLNISFNNDNAPVFNALPVTKPAAPANGTYGIYYHTLANDITDPDMSAPYTFTKISGPDWLIIDSNGSLSGTPLSADLGENFFVVQAQDTQGALGIGMVKIEVTENSPPNFIDPEITDPEITFTCNQMKEGSQGVEYSSIPNNPEVTYDSIADMVVDADVGDTLTFTKIEGPTWLDVHPSTGDISGVPGPDDILENTLKVRVEDDALASSVATIKICIANTINDAPHWLSANINKTAATEGQDYANENKTIELKFADPDIPAGDYGKFTIVGWQITGVWHWPPLDPSASWLHIADGGALSGTPPTSGYEGENVFTVSMTDASGLAPQAPDSETATLKITVVNPAPGFPEPLYTLAPATEDEEYIDPDNTLVNEANDPDGDDLTFSKIDGPSWLSVSSSGTLSGVPENNKAEKYSTFTVRVTDAQDAYSETTIKIYVNNTNDPPQWASLDFTKASATKNQAYTGESLADQFVDEDPDDFGQFAKDSGPPWLIIDTNGDLSGTPSESDLGENVFTVRVTDSAGAAPDPPTATLRINVITPAPDCVEPMVMNGATEDIEYSDTLFDKIIDPEGHSLTFSKISGPAWLAVDPNTGDLTGLPANDDAVTTPNTFVVRATNPSGAYCECTVDIEMTNINDPPKWTSLNFTKPNATEGQFYTGYSISGRYEDPDEPAGDYGKFTLVSWKVGFLTKPLDDCWLTISTTGELSG